MKVVGIEWRSSRASWKAMLVYSFSSGRDESVVREECAGREVKGWGWSWMRGILVFGGEKVRFVHDDAGKGRKTKLRPKDRQSLFLHRRVEVGYQQILLIANADLASCTQSLYL